MGSFVCGQRRRLLTALYRTVRLRESQHGSRLVRCAADGGYSFRNSLDLRVQRRRSVSLAHDFLSNPTRTMRSLFGR
ncbi:hypothetical protein [Herbiconiux liukaitaii]|uniref:hypothetical protein n=1 Tax=Herbiconiux liukaitaii TaxID=3342799 RepID=UPI0035B9B483